MVRVDKHVDVIIKCFSVKLYSSLNVILSFPNLALNNVLINDSICVPSSNP